MIYFEINVLPKSLILAASAIKIRFIAKNDLISGRLIFLMKSLFRLAGFTVIGLAAATATGVIYELSKRNRLMKKLLEVSNEGYETAPDIIFPDKTHSKQPDNLKYGPYIPKYF